MFARIQVVRPAVASLLLVMGLTMQACEGATEPTAVPPDPRSAATGRESLVGEHPRRGVGAVLCHRCRGSGCRVIEWTSSDPAVVMVSPEGLATGVGLGWATLSATRAGYAATARISVSGRRQRSIRSPSGG